MDDRTKEKLRIANLGKKYGEETRIKHRISALTNPKIIAKYIKKGQRISPKTEFKKGIVPWNKGGTLSKESKEKMRQAKLKNPTRYWLGKHFPIKGEMHHNWKGGTTEPNMKIRRSLEYILWRRAVFARDDYRCLDCGERGGKLEADHIYPFALFPRLRLVLENGRTLCRECHRKTATWGNRIYSQIYG